MIDISKREQFYQQEYCGCVYSLRDTNRHRRSQGRERITLGVKFYGKEELQAQQITRLHVLAGIDHNEKPDRNEHDSSS